MRISNVFDFPKNGSSDCQRGSLQNRLNKIISSVESLFGFKICLNERMANSLIVNALSGDSTDESKGSVESIEFESMVGDSGIVNAITEIDI